MRSLQKRAIVFRHIRGVEFGQDCDLLDNIFDLVFCIFDIDDLDRDGLSSTIIDTGI